MPKIKSMNKKVLVTEPLNDFSFLNEFKEFYIVISFANGSPDLQVVKNSGIKIYRGSDGLKVSYSNGVYNYTLLEISKKIVYLFGPIARLVGIYSVRIKDCFHISNVPENLLKSIGHTDLSDFGLAVALTRKNTPITHLYTDIEIAAPCSVYEISATTYHYKGTFFSNESGDFNNAKKLLLDYFEAVVEKSSTVYVLCTGGLDSRANLSLLLEIQPKLGFDIKLIHIDFSDPKRPMQSKEELIDQELTLQIAQKLNIELITYSFTEEALNKTRFKLYTDERFLRQNPVIPRPDTTHFFFLLNLLKKNDPTGVIVGLQTDFHKGSKYHLMDELVAENYESLKVSEKYLKHLMGSIGFHYTPGKQETYLSGLKERVSKFVSNSSKIDYIVLETFVSNFGLSRSLWNNLFQISFPFLNLKFASIVIKMDKKEKINGNIPRKLVESLTPELYKIPFNTGTVYPKKYPFPRLVNFIKRIIARLTPKSFRTISNLAGAISQSYWKNIKYDGDSAELLKLMSWLQTQKNWVKPNISIFAVQMLALKLIYIERETGTKITIK